MFGFLIVTERIVLKVIHSIIGEYCFYVSTVSQTYLLMYFLGSATETSPSSRQWPDDLIDIVNEPMGQTLERMKKYSNSMSQVDRGTKYKISRFSNIASEQIINKLLKYLWVGKYN